MKNLNKSYSKKLNDKTIKSFISQDKVNQKVRYAVSAEAESLYSKFDTSAEGKTKKQFERTHNKYGDNTITYNKKDSLFKRLYRAFVNPFTLILATLALISLVTDVLIAEDKEYKTLIIVSTMVLISGLLRFIQETRSGNAAKKLLEMIETTTLVKRHGESAKEIPIHEVVVGDLIYLSAGDMVPADLRITKAKDLFISQSSLTGESEPVEKFANSIADSDGNILDKNNIAFMGTNVLSGSAEGIVVATGDHTIFGTLAQDLNIEKPKTSFEKGVNAISMVLIKFMLVMVPIVFFINGITKGNWLEALLFAISIAVGLTPEMLPMIVTTALAKGSVAMSRKKVIVKNLDSIQNLGAMNILCTDKTGTITEDNVVLQYHLDVDGSEDTRVLRHAFLNSYYQTGLKNLMDIAIIKKLMELKETDAYLSDAISKYNKIDEIPFDFNRRRMSVVVEDTDKKVQMITKGAVEEMLSISSYVDYKGQILELTEEMKKFVIEKVSKLNNQGMRVIAVSQKTNPSPVGEFSVKDESEMVLIGYLAFLDPPKPSSIKAIQALNEHGVQVKIITGDNELVTQFVCRQVGISFDKIYLGENIEKLDDQSLGELAQNNSVFAKVSPSQKARIVSCLRKVGNVVGFMGDGINDAAAIEGSDVGISVDNAVDIAKESADVILLEKDLMVLEEGIIEGRKTYANMIKYIKMTASSNFGNVFSVLVASAFLPFLPMAALHLILLNLIYDLSCTAIPWDNVDEDFLKVPRKWDASSAAKFMLWIGPTSSVFDITTYFLMYFVICPMSTGGVLFHNLTDPTSMALYIAVFQAGWFVESMWTQALVIHMIRTPKIPFIESRASLPLTLFTFTGIFVLTFIPFTEFGKSIGLAPLPLIYFAYLALTVFLYICLVTVLKRIYVKRYVELL